MSILEDSVGGLTGAEGRRGAARVVGVAPRVAHRRLVQLPLSAGGCDGGLARTVAVTELFTGARGPHVEEDLFTDRADLMIGLNAASITGVHTYLVVDEIRIDGRLVYLPERRNGSRVVHDGMLVRCVGLPDWHKENLRAWVRSKESVKAATCVAVACKILYQIGNLGLAPRRGCWFPGAFFSHLAHHGLHSRDGKPVEHRFYAINRDAGRLWSELGVWRLLPGMLRRAVAMGREHPRWPRR